VVDVGTHTVIITRPGREPEVRTVSVKELESAFVAEVPTYLTQEEKDRLAAEQKKLEKGSAVIKIDPSLPKDWIYTVDGFKITPGDGVLVDPGTHSVIVYRPGYEPELRTISTRANETYVTGEIPHYKAKEDTTKSTGGGGGGGGGGSTSSRTTQTKVQYTTLSFGEVTRNCRVWLDEVEIEPVVDVKYSVEPGYHSVVILCPDNMGKTLQVYAIAKQNTHVNPILEPVEEGTEEEEEEEEEEQEETEEEEVYYVTFTSDPQGAKVLINNTFIGEWTPCRVPLYKGIYLLQLYKTGLPMLETYLWVGEEVLYGQLALDTALSLGYDVPEGAEVV
jgi:hypothetical protein